MRVAEAVAKLLKAYALLSVLYLCVSQRIAAHNRQVFRNVFPSRTLTSVNLIVAHPDDETMFFSPTLLQLHVNYPPSVPLRVICLTNGDADGLGAVREQELRLSLQLLLPARNTSVIVEGFEDGMGVEWDTQQVVATINRHVSDASPLLLTFDEHGVSGHINHVSCNTAVSALVEQREQPEQRFTALYLNSKRYFPPKYGSFVVDLARIITGRQPPVFMSTFPQYLLSLAAMCNAHASQMVWFRWGWWLASRFVFVNELHG